ncbi:site-specific DNA-methyltransferase [Xanthomonas campestris pv. raphani]|uniref:site-specific DNA-methyltransferase n=1 Tax=Xanthomonas campestris TaxID=339 RepID=UPI001F2E7467|nr:DNA methyltransferase [Xanthomonas campestris]MCF8825481.1 site-specific DNA-methyltransferase [Xanthomonas campestris pv. raphani]MEA9931475.1 DNA methyltransferase [Xanthomonas campestris pv. raphani]
MPLLNWSDRDEDLTRSALTPYRLLEPVASLSYGEVDAPNMLIEGDNLDALKALLPYYAGQVKCIFIDPPYNTKSAFQNYDDNLEHSKWLSMMYPRLALLRELLAEDGSIWITIDKNESHYLKVICDEIFHRKNFIAEIIWQKRTSRENRAAVGSAHDTILVYGKMEAVKWKKHRHLLPPNNKGYSNPDGDPKGPWRSIPFSAQGFRANQMYDIVTASGAIQRPPKGRCWGATEPEFLRLRREGRVYFPKNGTGKPRIKAYPWEDEGLVPMSLWLAEDAGSTEEAKKEILDLFADEEPFDTPKPERLLRLILEVVTRPGELVLDSFLGSGTTAAVAHKMGRRWVGIECSDNARKYCQPRLKKVIEGEQGGISSLIGWEGGGGARYFKLGVPVFDDDGHIREGIKFEHLAAHVWFAETGTARSTRALRQPFLGEHHGIGYYLLFNGVLGDESKTGGNVLTTRVLKGLQPFHGPKVIYGESCDLPKERLEELQITFKQTPYDIKAR